MGRQDEQDMYEDGSKKIDVLQVKTEDAKHKDETKGAEYQAKTQLAYPDIMNYEKENDCIQTETEISKNYKAGDKPKILQAKTADADRE